MNDEEPTSIVANRVNELIDRYVQEPSAFALSPSELDRLRTDATADALQDLFAFAQRDAAAYNSPGYIISSYASYSAVLHYRVANAILLSIDPKILQARLDTYTHRGVDGNEDIAILKIARKISEIAKVETGVEIHPAATIGGPFIIDHGAGTVIGETAEIGKDCCFLHAVLLGASRMTDAPAGSRRHPRIGNGVQISGGVQIIGDIRIGDNVVIDPGAKITGDIPAGTKVRVVCSVQLCRPGHSTSIYGVVPHSRNEFTVYGQELSDIIPTLCEAHVVPLDAEVGDRHLPYVADPNLYLPAGLPVVVITRTAESIRFRIDGEITSDRLGQLVLALESTGGAIRPMYLTNVQAFRTR